MGIPSSFFKANNLPDQLAKKMPSSNKLFSPTQGIEKNDFFYPTRKDEAEKKPRQVRRTIKHNSLK
jgi:hypothetical protein